VARAAARALRPGGLLVFTVEHAEPEPPPPGYLLAHHGRYVHGEPYVRAALEEAGLAVVSIGYAQLRTEHLKPVAGLVVTARRPA
jgi:predicted TPR repeat methyltransferase